MAAKDLVLLIGQSNNKGRAERLTGVDDDYSGIPNTYQFSHTAQTVKAATHPLEHAQPLSTSLGKWKRFAEKYEKRFLQPGRELMFVPVSFGGAGFENGAGSLYPGGARYADAVNTINAAMATDAGNRIVFVSLWHGERDAITGTTTYYADLAYYWSQMKTDIAGLDDRIPFSLVKPAAESESGYANVIAGLQAFANESSYRRYIDLPGQSYDVDNHYDRDALLYADLQEAIFYEEARRTLMQGSIEFVTGITGTGNRSGGGFAGTQKSGGSINKIIKASDGTLQCKIVGINNRLTGPAQSAEITCEVGVGAVTNGTGAGAEATDELPLDFELTLEGTTYNRTDLSGAAPIVSTVGAKEYKTFRCAATNFWGAQASLTPAEVSWAATTAYSVNDEVLSTEREINLVCTNAGTSGAAEPVLSGDIGNAINDGTVIWDEALPSNVKTATYSWTDTSSTTVEDIGNAANIRAELGIGGASTGAELGDIASAINTTGKATGKPRFDSTSGQPVYATGSAASAAWNYADGTQAYAPV